MAETENELMRLGSPWTAERVKCVVYVASKPHTIPLYIPFTLVCWSCLSTPRSSWSSSFRVYRGYDKQWVIIGGSINLTEEERPRKLFGGTGPYRCSRAGTYILFFLSKFGLQLYIQCWLRGMVGKLVESSIRLDSQGSNEQP